MAEARLEIYDASGAVVIDRFTSCMRISDHIISTGGTNGSYSDDVLSSGVPFYMLRSASNVDGFQGNPAISFAGNTISWDYISSGVGAKDHQISFGAY